MHCWIIIQGENDQVGLKKLFQKHSEKSWSGNLGNILESVVGQKNVKEF